MDLTGLYIVLGCVCADALFFVLFLLTGGLSIAKSRDPKDGFAGAFAAFGLWFALAFLTQFVLIIGFVWQLISLLTWLTATPAVAVLASASSSVC